jgi:hypothetical protein
LAHPEQEYGRSQDYLSLEFYHRGVAKKKQLPLKASDSTIFAKKQPPPLSHYLPKPEILYQDNCTPNSPKSSLPVLEPISNNPPPPVNVIGSNILAIGREDLFPIERDFFAN